MQYGHNRTIHRTKLLNIEVDKETGEVVSVWFRCLALPFSVSEADEDRADDMRRMYAENEMYEIEAVEVTTPEEKRAAEDFEENLKNLYE